MGTPWPNPAAYSDIQTETNLPQRPERSINAQSKEPTLMNENVDMMTRAT
jgi:hypothetical protein